VKASIAQLATMSTLKGYAMELFAWEPPDWLKSPAWDAFVKVRKEKGKRAPFTDEARDRIVLKLDQARQTGIDVHEVLWLSVENGWSGVFPERFRPAVHSRREVAAAAEFVPTSKQGGALDALQRMKR